MNKRLLFLGGACVAIFFYAAWRFDIFPKENGTPSILENSAPHVVTTFFPTSEFAQAVMGSAERVTQVVPEGAEPHDYEPSPADMVTLFSADIAVIYGGGMDAWADELVPDLTRAGVRVVRIADVVSLANDEKGMADPHAWLDPVLAQDMVRALAYALREEDPARASEYKKNEEAYIKELARVHEVFTSALAECASQDIFVAHDAFGYWERAYAVRVHAVAGLSHEAEPSVQDVRRIIEEARSVGATTIFFEDSEGSAFAGVIARELGITTDVLSPVEFRTEEEVDADATYLSIMERNIQALTRALACTE